MINPIPFMAGLAVISGIGLAACSQGIRQPVRLGEQIVPSFLRDCAPPIYSSAAEERQLTGEVVLDVAIDSVGVVSSAQVITGHSVLRPAAEEAVNAWRFEGMLLNGEPVPVLTYVTLTFAEPSDDDPVDDEVADEIARCFRSVPEP